MYYVTESELDEIASGANAINLALFGISVGGLISFGSVLATIAVNEPKQYAAFVALAALSGMCTIYFGIKSYADHRANRKKLAALKRDDSANSPI